MLERTPCSSLPSLFSFLSPLFSLFGLGLFACQSGGQLSPPEGSDTKVEPATVKAASDTAEPGALDADLEGGRQIESTLAAPSAMMQVREKAPPAKLYEQPVERRLYSDRIESSSFLWNNWNRFQENYHANYTMDGDPKTAWTEGADNSGKDEWVKIHLSPVEGVTQIRLRMQNGYHKSKSLYKKNARLKTVQITALPSGETHTAKLPDSMDWQEITFTQPEGLLNELEIKAVEVYEGTRYTDLCISEVEVYATGLTVENPDFEKKKLDDLIAWKKERVAAAQEWKTRKDEPLPISSSYRVIQNEQKMEKLEHKKGEPYFFPVLGIVEERAPSAKEAVARAKKALKANFKDYARLQIVVAKKLTLPLVDGLYVLDEEDPYYGLGDGFMLPTYKGSALLLSTNLNSLDVQGKRRESEEDCKPGETRFWRVPSGRTDGPLLQELIMETCFQEEGREGYYTYLMTRILEFDEEGRLILTVGPEDVQWFEWREGPSGPVLSGGLRLSSYNGSADKLVEVREEESATQPTSAP